jgi:hypothetical protein
MYWVGFPGLNEYAQPRALINNPSRVERSRRLPGELVRRVQERVFDALQGFV